MDPNTTNHISSTFVHTWPADVGLCDPDSVVTHTADGIRCVPSQQYTAASGLMVVVGAGRHDTNLGGCYDSVCSSRPLPALAGALQGFPL